MNRDVLLQSIQRKDIKVLRWYVEHSHESDSIYCADLDAEARMAYYQAQLAQQKLPLESNSEAEGLKPSFSLLGQASTPSASSSSFPPSSHRMPIALQPSLRQATQDAQGSIDLPATNSGSNRDLPLLLHRKLSRRLFRDYSAYVPNQSGGVGGGSILAVAESGTEQREQGNATKRYGWYESHPSSSSSPRSDTSTFLLRRVGEVTMDPSSPKTVSLHHKNTVLHEDEERVDIVQLEAYEFQMLASLISDSYRRALRQTHDRQRVNLETQESQERLRVSSLQVDLWSGFLHAVQLWSQGPAKAQNALLMNEIVLRHRIANEEASARFTLLTVHRREAEHQLSEMRRLRWLEREHQRAATMHKQLMIALAIQGVDPNSTSSSSTAVSPLQHEYVHRAHAGRHHPHVDVMQVRPREPTNTVTMTQKQAISPIGAAKRVFGLEAEDDSRTLYRDEYATGQRSHVDPQCTPS